MPQSPSPSSEKLLSSEETRRKKRLAIIIASIILVATVAGVWLLVLLNRPEITTSAGTLVITKVRLADSVECPGPRCVRAKPGYRILIIWMERKNGGDIIALANSISLKSAYVGEEDGSQMSAFRSHLNVSPPWIYLAFAVKDNGRDFKLMLPSNPAIDLNPILYFVP